MTPVYTSDEVRAIDRSAIDGLGVSSNVLMENAARGACDVVLALCDELEVQLRGSRMLIACGRGNNGGDGLALARHLLIRDVDVRCVLVDTRDMLAEDARTQLSMLEALDTRRVVDLDAAMTLGGDYVMVIDALLGTGAHGAPRAEYARALEWLDGLSGLRIALDVPTGLDADTGRAHTPVFRADVTVTMAAVKPGLLLNDGNALSGRVHLVHIGIPPSSYPPARCWLLDDEAVAELMPVVEPTRHKYDRGRALIIGGSVGMFGAVIMTAEASLRAGAGLTVLALPARGVALPHPVSPEIMTRFTDAGSDGAFRPGAFDAIASDIEQSAAVAIGPGLSRSTHAAELVRSVLSHSTSPVVLDADGLAPYAHDVDALSRHVGDLVITPHHGEMSRLIGSTVEDVTSDPLACAREVAARARAIVVLKGAPTIVAAPDGRSWINTAGNPGMATGGSGDVLTGIITSLAAQISSVESAALLGVYLHSVAADLAVERTTEHAMVATDIIRFLPDAYRRLIGGNDA